MPGVAARNGYPIPGADKDGVSDDEDLCPDIFGSLKNHGCPEIAQEVIKKANFAAKNILFQTGTATLKPSSFIGLKDMAQIMKEIWGIHLKIDGHTDIVGSYSFNIVLSENRANVVAQYMISQGINVGGIKTTKHGKILPMANSNTPVDRQQNRRVELKLLYD